MRLSTTICEAGIGPWWSVISSQSSGQTWTDSLVKIMDAWGRMPLGGQFWWIILTILVLSAMLTALWLILQYFGV